MKVLMLTSDFYDTGHGGVEGHVLGIARAYQAKGHRVVVVRSAPRERQSDYDPAIDNIEYHVLPAVDGTARRLAKLARVGGRAGLLVEFLRRLAFGITSGRLVHQLRPHLEGVDIVHQHNFLESWGLGRRLAAQGMPVAWTNHLGEFLYLRRLPLGRRILRLLTKHYTVAFAPSAELADASAISPAVHLIPNGVDRSRFHPVTANERRSQRAALGWPDDRAVVLIPRRWSPTKGVVFAAQAMTLEAWPERTYVVFSGSGTAEYPGYAAGVREFLARSRVDYEVHERVDQREMAQMLRCADVCVIPSVKEATSLSALEAMASGVTVVAANIGGLPELIEPGVTGFLHDAENPSSIAAVLQEGLAADACIAEAAMTQVAVQFSWDAVAARTMALYPRSRSV